MWCEHDWVNRKWKMGNWEEQFMKNHEKTNATTTKFNLKNLKDDEKMPVEWSGKKRSWQTHCRNLGKEKNGADTHNIDMECFSNLDLNNIRAVFLPNGFLGQFCCCLFVSFWSSENWCMFSCLFVVILHDPLVLILACTRDAARGKKMEGLPGEARVWECLQHVSSFSDFKPQWISGRPMLPSHQIPLQLSPYQVTVSEAQKTWRSFLRHKGTGEIHKNKSMRSFIFFYIGPYWPWTIVSTIVDSLGIKILTVPNRDRLLLGIIVREGLQEYPQPWVESTAAGRWDRSQGQCALSSKTCERNRWEWGQGRL